MNPIAPKTPEEKPFPDPSGKGESKGVFRSLFFWKEASQLSLILFAAAIAVLAITGAYFAGWVNEWGGFVKVRQKRTPVPLTQVQLQEPTVPTHARAIDGLAIPETQPVSGRYYAVTIDNHVEARPQSGINLASVVYEVPVEGGITRFLAVFPDDVSVEKIGPVRSARPYFLDWVAEYDALYAHVGGSNEALDNIKKYGIRDMNEFFQGGSFWRAKGRGAPHNTYTSTKLLGKNYERRFAGNPSDALESWKFKTDAPIEERPEDQKVVVDYGDSSFKVTWIYDKEGNRYRRMQAGRTIKTLDGQEIFAKNVVVQFVKIKTIDSYGRKEIGLIGKGDAQFAIDGQLVSGTWSKASRAGRTRFYDASQNEIVFNAGTTWVEVVNIGTDVTAE